MRITTGIYKGRRLKAPEGIRPTQQKVRKALFDILGDISGSSFLELFAGSGSVGFEALSRGVRHLALVESNRKCLLAIRENIESLKLKDCFLCPLEAGRSIKEFFKEKRKFDIIFLDPPYYKETMARGSKLDSDVGQGAKKTLHMLGVYDILTHYGLVAVQHLKKDSLPEEAGFLKKIKESRYGDTALSFYRKVS